MHKYIRYLGIGVLASLEVLISGYCSCGSGAEPRPLVRQDITQKAINFELKLSASDHSSDGTVVAYNSYISDDGVGVFLTVEKHRSATSARNALRARIRKATRIVERGNKLDRDGQRVGERIVLTQAERPRRTIGGVIWVDKAKLYAVESSSLNHALEFEKQNYR